MVAFQMKVLKGMVLTSFQFLFDFPNLFISYFATVSQDVLRFSFMKGSLKFIFRTTIDVFSFAVENVFTVHLVLLSVSSMNLIPDFNVEAKVNVEILVMVVVEDAIRLPWLPPVGLEVNSRMINNAMVINVDQDRHKYGPVDWEENHGADENTLHVKKFNRVNCCHAKGCWLLVLVMKFMEVFVEER